MGLHAHLHRRSRVAEEIDKYIPEKDMVYNRPKYHGQEVVKGALRYIYAEDGSCKYQPKSMADYDKDQKRVNRPAATERLTDI